MKKKATPIIKKYLAIRYEIDCPHCHTYIIGGFNEDVIQYKCRHCKKVVIIIE